MKTILTCLIAMVTLITPAMSQIKPGRAIQIIIMGVPSSEKPTIDGIYPVSESGTVNMPHIGNIRAAGLMPESLAVSIQNAYRNAQIYSNPTIQVIATDDSTIVEQVVHVGGHVGRPGPVKFQRGLTLYQAVMAAGGPTPFGSLRRVSVFRGGSKKTYDLTQAQFMRIPLEPNDTLEIPQKNLIGR